MPGTIFEQKAFYIGTWKDDAVTDNIIKEIATLTSLEKGRKVKLHLSSEGLKITKSNFFQGKILFDFIPLYDIFFMTTNQRHAKCLLCIVKDPHHKYMIVAFRCKSELVVGTFVQTFKELKRTDGQKDNVEFRQKEDGNWTLRERSNANARRELQQLFATDKTAPAPQLNGGIFYKKDEKRNGYDKKRTIYDETPYIPLNGRTTTTYTYDPVSREDKYEQGKTIHNVGTQAITGDDETGSVISDVSSMKGEMEALSSELREVKYLLEKSTGISAQEHYRMAGKNGTLGNNNNDSYAINYNNNPKHSYMEPIVVIDDNENDGVVRMHVPDYRSFGVQTAPKTRSRAVVDGPSVARSYRSSTSSTSNYDPENARSAAEIEKQRYKVHTVERRGNRHSTTGPEVEVTRDMGGLSVEDGVVYAAERDSNITTVEYPQSTLGSRRHTGSVAVANPQTYTISRRSGSLKTAQYGLVPSVVERRIEHIYPRPVLVRRDYVYAAPTIRRSRPHSVHAVRPSEYNYVYGSQIISNDF